MGYVAECFVIWDSFQSIEETGRVETVGGLCMIVGLFIKNCRNWTRECCNIVGCFGAGVVENSIKGCSVVAGFLKKLDQWKIVGW